LPKLLLGDHFAEPATERNATRWAHDREAHSVVAQLLQHCASFSRTQIEELVSEVPGVKKHKTGFA
jgi:hypothetical protein